MMQIIILAAGKGTRMGSDLPKVLVPLQGKPMVAHLLDSVMTAKPELDPILVVSPSNKEIIKESLANYSLRFAIQEQQLGTGHAVGAARNEVDPRASHVLVLYGDHPFLGSKTIERLLKLKPQAITLMPTLLPDYSSWHANFYYFGRIIRDDEGKIKDITEYKDATEKEREILEVNPGYMCFNKEWLFANIDKLQANNQAHEFYLTDMAEIAAQGGYPIDSERVDPIEAMGINKAEELEIAEALKDK